MLRERPISTRVAGMLIISCGAGLGSGAAQTPSAPAGASTTSTSALRKDLYFYHGSDGNSSLVRRGSALAYYFEDGKQLRYQLASGSNVCVTVVNAHPVNYSYSLGVAIDTTRPVLPTLPAPLTALLGPFKAPDKSAAFIIAKAGATPTDQPTRDALILVTPLGDAVRVLADEVSVVEAAAKDSDAPEPLTAIDALGPDPKSGYRSAQAVIKAQSDGAGHFRSGTEKLTAYFEKLAAAAGESIAKHRDAELAKAGSGADGAARREAIAKEVGLLTLIKDALLDQGKELAVKAGNIVTAFSAKGRVELCGKVGSGPTTLTLTIAPKEGRYGNGRDIKEAVDQEIIIRPPYDRPVVSMHPVALAALATDVPQFEVRNGTLIGPRDDDIAYRIGAVVNLNVLSFGADGMLGFGIALGAGVTANTDIISDLFVAPVISLRDVIRIGFGVGASRFPSRVKGMSVDQPFDANAGKLEDLIETSMRRAYHIVFVLPGIKL